MPKREKRTKKKFIKGLKINYTNEAYVHAEGNEKNQLSFA